MYYEFASYDLISCEFRDRHQWPDHGRNVPRLTVHPDSRADAAGFSIDATLQARAGTSLALRYTITGPLDRLRLPAPADAAFEIGLWKHSCVELFVAVTDEPPYHEFNFSPSGRWALFGFRDYRDGEAIEAPRPAPRLQRESRANRLQLDVSVDLAGLAPGYATADLTLGLAAVIEHQNGRLSYWALRHAPGAPDFHHRDGFDLRVEAESPA